MRAIPEGDDPWVRGRMMSRTPTSIEILTIGGRHVYIAREVVVRIDLIAHTRPAYIDDEELCGSNAVTKAPFVASRNRRTKGGRKGRQPPLGMMPVSGWDEVEGSLEQSWTFDDWRSAQCANASPSCAMNTTAMPT